MSKPRTCKQCGCTEARACMTNAGPCAWVGTMPLCSNPECIAKAGLLTKVNLRALGEGCRHRDGVINPTKVSNFDKPERRMEILVRLGLATPNAHGDWYITAAGRRVWFLSTQENDHGRE